MILALGSACTSAPAAATLIALLSATPPGPLATVLSAMLSILVAAVGIRVLAILLRRHARTTRPAAAALATVCLQGMSTAALDRTAPFRIGALSLALYLAPALITAAAATARSRGALGGCAVAAVALGLSAPSLGGAQQHWYAEQWLAAKHIPSVVEVIDVPGMRQLPYTYYQTSRQLTAIYSQPLFGTDAWAAVETVTAGLVDPCGPLTTADGDGLGTQSPPCTALGDGLWQRGDTLGVYGYVLQRDGVTITLAGPPDNLAAAIEAARPATDTDLWQRTAPLPASPIGWLLR